MKHLHVDIKAYKFTDFEIFEIFLYYHIIACPGYKSLYNSIPGNVS